MDNFFNHINEMKQWMSAKRFEGITRLYSARQVVEQQGTIFNDYSVAKNAAAEFYELLRELYAKKESITTFGPYTPSQAVMMRRMGIKGIYLGGWATSAKGSITEDPGADLASYPLSQVPDEAAPIVRALLAADKNQKYLRSRMTEKEQKETPEYDYRPFIIADADTGHGGDAHVRNLVRRFVEAGVTGYHIEDQRSGTKKCGHQGGKVLVAIDEQIKRLNAARFQLDTMRVSGIIVARTDAEAATLLDSNSDGRDHPFILGVTNLDIPSYRSCTLAILRRFYDAGVEEINGHMLYNLSEDEFKQANDWFKNAKISVQIDASIKEFVDGKQPLLDRSLNAALDLFVEVWEKESGLTTLKEAVADVMAFHIEEGAEYDLSVDEWLSFAKTASFFEANQKINEMGLDISWDCELSRTPEGYYQARGGLEYAIAKSLAVAPFCDIIWMETKTANLEYAKKFADAMHAEYPDKMLAYNLSPSFNWDTTGMTDDEMRAFPIEMGKMGFVFNFITYGGHQIDGLASEEFATALQQTGMLALAKLQRKFRLLESPYKTPQTHVGGPRLDGALAASSGRTATTKAMGKGSTQSQHLVQTEVPTKLLENWLDIWAKQYKIVSGLKVKLRPHRAGSELLELSVLDDYGNKMSDIVFANIQDRRGNNILSVRDQNTLNPDFRMKRFMTLNQIFLMHRYKTNSLHYVTPSDDNKRQTEGMKKLGIFKEVSQEIGDIIVANVDVDKVKELLNEDLVKLKKLIAKE
ncbi:MAG: isocitrate lyase family protein [Calditrichaeota bacterium]|nr:MAG: isocitrate lyase family protein [Calditrichota bacterium]MBL1204629.1 isocitrate lyase family protein [Calditrichota bacterium]NOG44458.1 isocitrate lyase family protein [Calditrichota bacterium]